MKAHKVTIYTDGACKGNPGPSGWAYHISMTNEPNKYVIKSGSILEGTNNIAELTAVIEALSSLKSTCIVDLYSDSMYVINGCTNWLNTWRKNGYRNARNKPIENMELWKQLDELLSKHSIKFNYVKEYEVSDLAETFNMMLKKIGLRKYLDLILILSCLQYEEAPIDIVNKYYVKN